jgi:hypothetical protein
LIAHPGHKTLIKGMYKIIGADGRPYGPIDADQLRRWIAEGRANASTQTLAPGATEWKPLGTLSEFAVHFAATQMPPSIAPVSGSHHRRTNPFALWGMILGILATVCCFCCCLNVPLGALGLVFSIIGLLQINENPDMYEGRGLAVVGIVLSSVGLLCGLGLFLSSAITGNQNSYYHPHNWHFPQ